MDSFFHFYEENLLIIYIIHIIVGVIISAISAIYLGRRYDIKSKEILQRDMIRAKEVASKSKFAQLMFKPSLHKNNRYTNFVFIFLFNLPIPFIGYILTIWIVWYLNNVDYSKKIVNTNILNLDEFGMSFLKVQRVFGEGSMTDVLQSKYTPKSKKLKALSSLSSNISPVNLQILKQTLKSPDDEIRMFGYSIINKAEKSLNLKINTHLQNIREERDKDRDANLATIAFSQTELAFLHWEMVYTELSHEGLKENFLNTSIDYINQAKEYYIHIIDSDFKKKKELQNAYKVCSNLYMLRGRIHMQKKEYEKAKAEFTIAQELLPNQDTFILPYLAEVYFLTGKYNIVKTLLKNAKGLELNATLYPIVQQWREPA